MKWPVRTKTIFMRVGSSLPITWLYELCWICPSALHPADHKFRHQSCVNLVVAPQLTPKCAYILTDVLPYSILSTPLNVVNLCHWSVELIIVCKPPNIGCTLLNTSGVAYMSTHDLVNLTRFCYDYKLCLSTITLKTNKNYIL